MICTLLRVSGAMYHPCVQYIGWYFSLCFASTYSKLRIDRPELTVIAHRSAFGFTLSLQLEMRHLFFSTSIPSLQLESQFRRMYPLLRSEAVNLSKISMMKQSGRAREQRTTGEMANLSTFILRKGYTVSWIVAMRQRIRISKTSQQDVTRVRTFCT